MHMLKIIHRDVKPENILFSPTFNKHVFIDFGCTGILNEAIGEVTFTKFAGTAAYCTEELVQLLG
jgi:serine/threonine protein kinase